MDTFAVLLPFLIYLLFMFAIIGVLLYFIIQAVKFMKNKTANDRQLLEKMDRLIAIQDQKNNSAEL